MIAPASILQERGWRSDCPLCRPQSRSWSGAWLRKGSGADGRRTDEVRQIGCRAGVLPAVHGSALFTRGETQALAVATLGMPLSAPQAHAHRLSRRPYALAGKLTIRLQRCQRCVVRNTALGRSSCVMTPLCACLLHSKHARVRVSHMMLFMSMGPRIQTLSIMTTSVQAAPRVLSWWTPRAVCGA